MALTKEQLTGIMAHSDEVKRDWARAYKAAVDEDNGEAIALLLKTAPRIKRASDAVIRIKRHVEDYVTADIQANQKFVATGDVDTDLAYASSRATMARKANSVHEFIQTVENL